MKCIISLIVISILFSCNEQQDNSSPQPVAPAESEETIVTETGAFAPPVLVNQLETVDSAKSIIMFPLAFGQLGFDKSQGDEEGSFSLGKRSGNGGQYWNIIFYNYKLETSWMLANDRKMLIADIDQSEQNDWLRKKYILYTIYSDDFNQDKNLTSEDPAYLYISNRDGKGFRRLSPEHMNVVTWNAIPGTEIILLTCMKDSDGDKKFGNGDQTNTYKLDLKDVNAIPKEIFSPAFKKELTDYFKKYWKPKEE